MLSEGENLREIWIQNSESAVKYLQPTGRKTNNICSVSGSGKPNNTSEEEKQSWLLTRCSAEPSAASIAMRAGGI